MVQETLTSLLKQLDVQSSHNEHSHVEKTCVELLDGGCSNPNLVLKQLIVALIKQDKYQRALNMLKTYKHIAEKFSDQIRLEKLYIYYKLNDNYKFDKLYRSIIHDDVDTIINKPATQTSSLRGLFHVRAQYCFKMGENEESYKLYRYLASSNSNEQDHVLELACNERAPLTSSPDLQIELPVISQINRDSYDLLFNESMILSAKGKFKESIKLLQQSLNMALDEGYENDIHTIQLQLAYVYQISGNHLSSKEILNPLLSKITPGSPLYLIAKNNFEASIDLSKYSTNFNLLIRELNFEKFNSLNLKQFTKNQWEFLLQNFMILRLFNNNKIKENDNFSILSRTLKKYTNIVHSVVWEPYKTQAKKLYHQSIKTVESGVEGESVIGLLLLTIQLLFVEKQFDNAIRLGELYFNKIDLLAITMNPILRQSQIIMIYILFQLYDLTDRNNSKNILLNKINEIDVENAEFWKHIGFQYLTLGNIDGAKNIFNERLSTEDVNSDKLIETVLNDDEFNIDRASNLVSHIDIDQLIADGVKPFESQVNKNKPSTLKANKILKKKIESKKQKKKEYKLNKFLTKNNLAKTPQDPERWLPVRDRSTYRPSKKQLAKQTQGGAMNKKAEQKLDITKKNTNNNKTSKNKKKTKGKNRK